MLDAARAPIQLSLGEHVAFAGEGIVRVSKFQLHGITQQIQGLHGIHFPRNGDSWRVVR